MSDVGQRVRRRQRFLSWESVAVALCAAILSLVFGFFLYQAFTSKAQQALYDENHAEALVDYAIVDQPMRTKSRRPSKHSAKRALHKQRKQREIIRITQTATSYSPSSFKTRTHTVKSLKHRQMTNHLVCVLSKNATKPADVPIELCTHLVYQELDMDRKTRSFHPRFIHSSAYQEFMAMRERFVTAKFVVALSGQLIHEATQAAQKDPGALTQIASDLASWLSKNELNGIAFTEQPLVNPSIGHVISVIKAFQAALEALGAPKPALIYGGYLIPKQNSDRSSIRLIKKLVKLVDIFVLETHYHEEEQYCKLVYPSIYVGEGDLLPSLPIKTALFWMEMIREEDDLSSISKMCFSLSLLTLSFDLTANARPTAGSWCTGRHWINYGDMCSGNAWLVPQEDSTVLSTFRRKARNWISYDSEFAIREKVSRAMDVFHGVCVAAYNVDQDDNEAHCDGVTRFPRLQAIRDVQKTHVDREFYGVEKKKAIPTSSDREDAKLSPPSAVLICIVGEFTSEQDRYPTDDCTHIIYKDMVFFGEHKSFRPKEKEHGFQAFMKLGAQSKAQLLIALDPQRVADFYMPLWRNPRKLGHFTRSAAEWLNAYGFDGIAILDQNAESIADVKRFLPVVKRIFDVFDTQDRKLSIVLGLNLEEHTNTPENVAEAFEDIATYVDYLIIQTHHMRSTPCNVSLTSAFLEHEALSSTVPVRTAISWMRILHVENETNVKLCFSLNMATVTFKTKDTGDGTICKSERWSNYRDSCLTTEGFKAPVKVEGSLSLYRSSKNSWQTFENEETVREKVERAVTLYPGVCVAAFYVEHEDSTGTCAPRFSRIAEISKALKRAHNLICIMSEKTNEREQYPEELCDFVVYMDLSYNGQEDKLVPKGNGSGFALFTSLVQQRTGNHLVAVSQDDIRECMNKWKDPLSLSHFVVTTTAWIIKNKFDGLAFLDLLVISDQIPVIFKMLQKFHEAFKENGSRSLLLMFGMQVKAFKSSVEEFLANLQHISKVVDYTILETHHSRPATTCNLLMPNSFREYTDLADNLPIITALDWAKQLQSLVVPPPNVCFSLNLAALNYELKSTSTKIGAPCQTETLVRYNQTCKGQDWAGPVMDDKSMAAFHYRGNQWQSFQTEDSITKMMRLVLKVNPSVCVAAYFVDYEDYRGDCVKNKPFPRLSAVRRILDQVVNH